MTSTLTAERLRELLHYDPATGIFTRLISCASNAQAGAVAGGINSSGYLAMKLGRATYTMHRLAFLYVLGRIPFSEVDHINGIRGDNRWCNLREASRSENQQNRKLNKNNTTGVTGISFYKTEQKWVVRISSGGTPLYIGSFKSLQEAVIAQAEAKRLHHPFQPVARATKEKGEAHG